MVHKRQKGNYNDDNVNFHADYDEFSLIIDVDGYEGPLHLLLNLAREQKVDLFQISIIKLVDQYLKFIVKAKHERIELAADYLVMAAWLAFLKSRLLLPKKSEKNDEIAPELLSSHLAWRLKRLEAMRKSSEKIMGLNQIGLDCFLRGLDENECIKSNNIYGTDLLDLLKAYGQQRNKAKPKTHKISAWPVYSLEEARENLRNKLPKDNQWHDIAQFVPEEKEIKGQMPSDKSFNSSLLSASLEMAKHGDLTIRQSNLFENVYIKRLGAHNA